MTQVQSDVETAFRDLTAAWEDLSAASDSPVQVRRTFVRFVGITQQITGLMRVEFQRVTGESWHAREFTGWTPVTDLFKLLRNTDEHEALVQILIHEAVTARSDLGALVTLQGTWELHDQVADKPPEGLTLVREDPATGGPSNDELPVVRRTYRFLLHGRTEEIQQALVKAGTEDVHLLAQSCYSTMSGYFQYYRTRLKANTGKTRTNRG